jgi:hypothetical protein
VHTYGPVLAVILGLILLMLGTVGVIVRTRAARVEEDFPDELATFDDLREAFD